MKPPFLRSAYNYDMAAASREGGTVFEGPGLTDQSFAEDCDINVLVRRFGVTGLISGVQMPPAISEFGEVFDFQSAMNLVRAAQESFAELDAEVRARFNNDPHRYVEFCSALDDKGQLANLAEMRKMGLAVPEVVPPPEPPPTKVHVVNSEVSDGSSDRSASPARAGKGAKASD